MPSPTVPRPHEKLALKQVQENIEKQITDSYRKRLNVQTLPQDVSEAIHSASQVAAERATRANLENEAFRVAKQFFQPVAVNELIRAKLTQAKDGVRLVSQSADLGQPYGHQARVRES